MKKLHSELVKWIVKLLLSITSTDLQTGEEGGDREQSDSSSHPGHVRHIESVANLKADLNALALLLNSFTKQLQT